MNREPAIELTEIDPSHPDGPWDPNVPVADTAHWDHLPESPPAPSGAPPPAPPEPTASAPRRFRFLPRTLTNRLVAGVVALVGVLVIATGTATYVALHSFLFDRLDQQLTATARPESLVGLVNHRFGAGFQGPQTVWIAVLGTAGALQPGQPSGLGIAQINLSAADRARLAAGTDKPISITTTDGAHLRLVSVANQLRQQTVSDPSTGTTTSQAVTVLVGLSTSEVDKTLHRLLLIELAIGGGAIVIAFLATSYGVRLSLRPLRRVTRTAQEVTAELSPVGAGLDRRVPVAPSEADSEAGQMAGSVNTLLGAVETQFKARVESEERMRQFLADASHELRTPLTSIRGYAELSRMRRANGEAADESDTLHRIEFEGTRMSRLVDDLLILARTDQGTPPLREPVDVGELIDDAIEGARAAYPHRRIDATAASGLSVYGDQDQLLRVVRNLIANAALHTDPDGPIHVSAAREGNEIVLRVTDAGPGLPPEEAAHVFERFWRADKARTRARGGSGLGLSIVSAIVDAHGGTASFDSSVERGSTVTVRLLG